ncbi:MAG TPA: PilZ domain-containing protein [Thermoanaerobaculia bacterium]|nr:PilZ domain-containing protein [Thermoanaerobaculia bacterium]
MKRLVDLTAADLASSPVWRYEGESGLDALVSPAPRAELSQADDEVFLAATDFDLYDGSHHKGFCFPADDSGIDYLQPAIVGPAGHVNFWTDGPVAPEDLAARWRALGKEPGQIFPAAFRCLVPVDGRVVSGWIAGVESSRDLTVAIREVSGGPVRADGPAGPAALDRAPTARPVEARREKGAPIDKRTARRRSAQMTVEFTQDALRGTGVAENISRRGMFVRASHLPAAGPQLRLTVKLPDGRKLVLTGRVVRSADASATGFGLRLVDDFPNYDTLFPGSRNRHR